MKLAALVFLFSGSAVAADACQGLIPQTLAAAVKKEYRDFRPPLSTDNSPEDIQWFTKQGGSGCFGVASADFDGDGRKDFILGLTRKTGDAGLVVVALARGRGWKLETLESDLGQSRLRLFVSAGKPGTYELTEALDGPGPNDTTPLTCPHAVAVFGGIEAWDVTACYNNGKWQRVQTSD